MIDASGVARKIHQQKKTMLEGPAAPCALTWFLGKPGMVFRQLPNIYIYTYTYTYYIGLSETAAR
jgi:hypothetical protein